MIQTALEGDGRVGVIVPHGVLFHGGAEGKIRQKLIEDNPLEAVIGLSANLFFGTGIPAAIVVFNRARKPWDKAKASGDRDQHSVARPGPTGPEGRDDALANVCLDAYEHLGGVRLLL